jgi:hypothetical protein
MLAALFGILLAIMRSPDKTSCTEIAPTPLTSLLYHGRQTLPLATAVSRLWQLKIRQHVLISLRS